MEKNYNIRRQLEHIEYEINLKYISILFELLIA